MSAVAPLSCGTSTSRVRSSCAAELCGLQTATRPIHGRWKWVYASLVFAVLRIGYLSPLDMVFVFGVGLLYGWPFERSRSAMGISIGHGQTIVVPFFIAPNLPAVSKLLGIA